MFTALLEKIALALDEAGIAYMVIGGQAVLLYGEPRLTKDIDITLGASLDRLADVLALAEKAELNPLVAPETFTRRTMVLPCEDPATGIRVDFVFSFSPYERQALERVRRVGMGEADVRFASLENVIIRKIITGRPRHDLPRLILRRRRKPDRLTACGIMQVQRSAPATLERRGACGPGETSTQAWGWYCSPGRVVKPSGQGFVWNLQKSNCPGMSDKCRQEHHLLSVVGIVDGYTTCSGHCPRD